MHITLRQDRQKTVDSANIELSKALDITGMILGHHDWLSPEYRAMEAFHDKILEVLEAGDRLSQRIQKGEA